MNNFKTDLIRPRSIYTYMCHVFKHKMGLCKSLLDIIYFGGKIHKKLLDKNSKNYNFEFVKIINSFLYK